MLFLGDILIARNVLKERHSRREDPWMGFDSLFRRADWVMGNFEGAVGSPEECVAGLPGPCFAAPESLLADFRRAGFSALSLANNHALDLGREGLQRTRRSFSDLGIPAIDFEGSPFFQVIGGRTIAFICLSMVPAKDGSFQAVPGIEAARKFRMARRFSDRIVVFVHWGSELQDWPNAEQIRAARWMVAKGADLVIGAHPHVIQDPACVEGKPVFYSLGNHLFDQKYPQTKVGLIADCALGPTGFACGSKRTEVPSGGFYPRLAMKKSSDAGADLDTAGWVCPDGGVNHEPAPASRNPGPLALESRLSGGSTRHRWQAAGIGERKVAWEGPAEKLLSASTFRLREKPGKVFLFRLERHFSPLDRETAPRPYVYEVTGSGPVARWRGSGLAWPLLDADMLDGNEDGILCALHRGDSFLAPNPETGSTRLAAYRWNGFGFTLVADVPGESPGPVESKGPPPAGGTGSPEPENPLIRGCREALERD